MSDEYTCSECERGFLKYDTEEWTEEMAQAERQAAFPEIPDSRMRIVCDDCHERLMKRYAS